MTETIAALVAAFITAVILLFAGFGWHLYQRSQDLAVERFNRLRRYRPDGNGNYDAFFDFQSGQHFIPEPGNTPYAPPAPQYVSVASPPVELQPRRRNTPPIVLNTGGYKVREVQPEQLSEPENEPEQLPEPGSSSEINPDYYQLLRQAKEGNRPKVKSISEITGCTKGGGVYQQWSKIWDEI